MHAHVQEHEGHRCVSDTQRHAYKKLSLTTKKVKCLPDEKGGAGTTLDEVLLGWKGGCWGALRGGRWRGNGTVGCLTWHCCSCRATCI